MKVSYTYILIILFLIILAIPMKLSKSAADSDNPMVDVSYRIAPSGHGAQEEKKPYSEGSIKDSTLRVHSKLKIPCSETENISGRDYNSEIKNNLIK